MTKLDKFCFFTPLKVAFISGALSLIGAFIILSAIDRPYAGQHGCDMSGILYGLMIFGNVFASFLSYLIALNLYKTVRNNKIALFLTFYFPSLFLFLISTIVVYESVLAFLLTNIFFLVPQTYYYNRFRKRLQSGEILEDFYEIDYSKE